MTSDSRLLARVAQSDRAAFHMLYERHAERTFRYVLSLIRAPHLAEEVLQETMIAVFSRTPSAASLSRSRPMWSSM